MDSLKISTWLSWKIYTISFWLLIIILLIRFSNRRNYSNNSSNLLVSNLSKIIMESNLKKLRSISLNKPKRLLSKTNNKDRISNRLISLRNKMGISKLSNQIVNSIITICNRII